MKISRALLFLGVITALPVYPQTREFERVLVPVMIPIPLSGAFGSLWETELVGRNTGNTFVEVTTEPGDGCRIPEGCVEYAFPNSTFKPHLFPSSGSGGPGFLYVEQPRADQLFFNLRLLDLSRAHQTWGTSIPLVYEKDLHTETIHLLDVPADPSFRTTLRIFDFDGTNDGLVEVTVHEISSYEPLVRQNVVLSGGLVHDDHPHSPAHARIDSLVGSIPDLDPADRLRIEVTPLTPGLRIWAFASVTNNETQHVTAIVPQ